jgi:6-phosphogluconolactonase (cycloisomerase 2 family)
MKLSWIGRLALALFASLALGLGMTACGGGTIAYLWVLGQQYNQIAAFKVDDFTGNLTQVEHEPFNSSGTMPVMLVVKPGGRYVYVLNQGTGGGPTTTVTTNGAPVTTCSPGKGASLIEFSVGGDGTLNQEQSYQPQGCTPVYLQMDSTGSYLYELDDYSPSGDGQGSITAYAVDPTTGRLSLQANLSSNPGGQTLTYWEVGGSPLMMKTTGSCLFTVDSKDQSIYPYGIGASGQLTPETTGLIFTHATGITSINGNGTYVILTDGPGNMVLPYTPGSGCTLNTFTGGNVNLTSDGTSNPVNSLISADNKYLYILDQSSTSTNPNQSQSKITGFTIDPSKGLTELTQFGSPWSVDTTPVCMVEDPTNKYMYISDHTPGQLTGKIYDDGTGALSDLTRGTTFNATGQAGCLALSGAVD